MHRSFIYFLKCFNSLLQWNAWIFFFMNCFAGLYLATLSLWDKKLSIDLWFLHLKKKKKENRGAWVAQSVERLTPGLSWGRDLRWWDRRDEIEPHVGLRAQCGVRLRFFLPLPFLHVLSLSKINKSLKKKKT